MTTANLISYIERHGFDAKALADGTILARSEYTSTSVPGVFTIGHVWEPIRPTMSAVREWLGY